MMTTMAALLGGLPLALGTGTGSELRRPLGITIVGGLIFSQVLTLYTTPVIYLYIDRLARRCRGGRREPAPGGRRGAPAPRRRMSISAPFIRRPDRDDAARRWRSPSRAPSAYRFLPVAPLPQVDFPTIQVTAALPGASPETMASSVATPLERQFGRIAGVTEMTSTSTLGSTTITLQFDLEPRHRRRRARRAGGDQRRRAASCPPNLPEQPDLPEGQPRRRADPDPRADLATSYAAAQMFDAANVDPRAEALAGRRASAR